MTEAWKAVRCLKWCDDGYRGMDRCNTCGCTGSELVHIASRERYPNTEKGWEAMVASHPEVEPASVDETKGNTR